MYKHQIKLIIFIFLIFSFLASCQQTKILEDIVFDNSKLNKISINAENKEIKVSYESSLYDPFIDHVMESSPSVRIISWLNDSVSTFGTMNTLVIDVQDASIIRKAINNQVKVAGVLKKTQEYKYEINTVLLFTLYDENDQILATTTAETFRSTTSSQFISLNERNNILNKLTLESLTDLSNISAELMEEYMFEYLL